MPLFLLICLELPFLHLFVKASGFMTLQVQGLGLHVLRLAFTNHLEARPLRDL